jgi:two-component system response regulator RegX3
LRPLPSSLVATGVGRGACHALPLESTLGALQGEQLGKNLKILVVEDDAPLREGLCDLLTGAGHEVEAVGDGQSAVDRGTLVHFDVILLDLMLPRLEGVEACRRLRTARPDVGILMLTARGAQRDRVSGLRAGADDYVTKPFAPDELLARLDALGRRMKMEAAPAERFEVDGCLLDLGRLSCERDGKRTNLTPREAGILRWLHLHRDRAVDRAELLERVWGVRGDLETRTVDASIVKLRRKIERDPASPTIVVSVQGVGYAWGIE